MLQILVIGYAPDAVDYTDPLIPKGVDEKKVAEGIDADMRKMRERGWDAEHLNIRADDDLTGIIRNRLAGKRYDCIVIGAGVRVTTKRIGVCETIVNAVRENAPQTPIGFNGGPDTSADAVSRVLPAAS